MSFSLSHCQFSMLHIQTRWKLTEDLILFVQVVNCHESVIYILAPLRYATVYGCSDATIVIGAVGKVVKWLLSLCEMVYTL